MKSFKAWCIKITRKVHPHEKSLQPTTHHCLRNMLTFAQFMGVFPVANLANEPHKLRFEFTSWRVLHSSFFSLCYLLCASFSFYKSLTVGIFLRQLITPLFYLHVFLTSILACHLSSYWKEFMLKWTRIEEQFLKRYPSSGNLHRKVNLVAFLIISVTFLEHALAIFNCGLSNNCPNNATGTEYLFRKQSHFIFSYMPYHFVYGLILMILSWTASFVWSFADLFIILISIIIAERFRQITAKIRLSVNEINGTLLVDKSATSYIKVYNCDYTKNEYRIWREIREDYDKITQIVGTLDNIFSNLVLLSYSGNLTFILIQLFNSLRQMESISEGVYFFYSFGYIITRILVVSIFGASINEQSQRPLLLLNSLPTEMYNEEIQRLITQVQVDCAALTGRNFFRITKGLVLSVAAAIITYELVLIQFNQSTINKYMEPNATTCL